jgi:hypothetical protein
MAIEIPEKLNGYTFYSEILKNTYQRILHKDFKIDFNMTKTKLANPEGFVNILATALMLKNKYNYMPMLYLPNSKDLLSYMCLADFFTTAQVPLCEVFKFNKEIITQRFNPNYFIPKIYGLFVHSESNFHHRNIEKIIKNIKHNLNDIEIDQKYFFMLQISLNQLVKNTIEHNPNHKKFGALGYYMAQKTPYNTIDFAFSDVGQGFRERMIDMLDKEDEDANVKYGKYKNVLKSNSYLFQQHTENPNLRAIIEAVNFRCDSKIPGIFQIKEFVTNNGGYLSIHSGNYTVKYEKDNKLIPKFHKSYFSGCHIKFEIPLKQKEKDDE